MALINIQSFNDIIIYELDNFESDVSIFKNIFIKEKHSFNSAQDSISLIKSKGTVKGLHFQCSPYQQAKLVTVIDGSILDFIVDLRPSSSTFLDHASIELSHKNNIMIFIPKGFAHGYISQENNTKILYKLSCHYSPSHEKTLNWRDETIGICWPNQKKYIVSEKDTHGQSLKELMEFL